jgi:nitroreductase
MTTSSHRLPEPLEPMLTRRSTSVFGAGEPTDDEIDAVLRAATTVPDHGGLRPWRLVVVRRGARPAFGAALAAAGLAADPQLGPEAVERLRSKAFVAPALIAVGARIDVTAKIPAWEQVASAACLGYALALAAHEVGLGAMWKSSKFRDGEDLRRVLDLAPTDEFLGWVNLGRPPDGVEPGPRLPVDLASIARVLRADGRAAAYPGR